MSRRAGFSLLELVLALSVLSILIGVAVPRVSDSLARARDARRLQDAKALAEAVEAYYVDHGRFPTVAEMRGGNQCGWATSTADGFAHVLVQEGYLDESPQDPQNTNGGSCHGTATFNYKYYLYGAGSYGAPAEKGPYYVIGVETLELLPASGEWITPGRDWSDDLGRFGFVIGGYANP